jgi:molybdate/tungstate transport system substrate-binding protein
MSSRLGLTALVAATTIAALLTAAGCEPRTGDGGRGDTVVVFVAASLTNAIRPQLDSFAAASGVTLLTESGASMEHVRKVTELHRIPDLLLLADDDVFPRHLAPNHTTWWADFARNRMVVAYTDRSKAAKEITDTNWFKVLTRPGIEVGRADPNLAPVGYRTLTLFALTALKYGQPSLAQRLVEAAPKKNVRSNAAELAALLAAGELDYIYDYESVARAQNFRYILMPLDVTGRPVTYALAIPTQAPHKRSAERTLAFFLSDSVRPKLRSRFVDMMDRPVVHGTGAPDFLGGPP